MVSEPGVPPDQVRLVAGLVRAGEIRTAAVRTAFLRVPREEFVRPEDRRDAYDDTPLPIGENQTISAPSMIAIMLEEAELHPGDRVLEIGTGSGYGAALLAALTGPENVVTMERIPSLAAWGRRNLEATGFREVTVVTGDGSLGWPERAPYDCILATAGAPHLPPAWAPQLSGRGRIVAPVGDSRYSQDLLVARRRPDGGLDIRHGTPCAFVPLVGVAAWPED